MLVRTFGWAIGVTIVVWLGALLIGGVTALALVAILSVLEISLSFDNAVINATVLERMDTFWQKLFLTVGILIAVFGMRLAFPLLIVGVTAHLSPLEAIRLAQAGGGADEPGTYANLLTAAHPAIAAFGGVFLLTLFLDFIFEERDVRWLAWLEVPLARIGKLDQLSVVVVLALLAIAASTMAEDPETVLMAGILGLGTYLLVNALGDFFGVDEDGDEVDPPDAAEAPSTSSSRRVVVGQAAFFLFLYLEVLDASFSFDGVIGAFAITQNIFIIASGLGVGAMYIRSLTVFLVRRGTLSEYVYLEHGAHWAIGALAVILLVSIKYEVPEVVTGLIGIAFIAAAFATSLLRDDDEGDATEPLPANRTQRA